MPEIFSWGIAYKGFERALIDVDLRYFDYKNTSLYGTKPIDGGLGWSSVFAVAVGGQYQATDRLTLRSGYLYNTNPIHGTDTLFNIQAPGFMTQMLALGASYKLTDDIVLSLAWTHQFRNSISGPVLQIPGERIKLDAQMDSIVVGLNVQFGGPRKHADNSISGDEVSPPAVPTGSAAPDSPPASITATPPPPRSRRWTGSSRDSPLHHECRFRMKENQSRCEAVGQPGRQAMNSPVDEVNPDEAMR